jgi:cyclically-permuted mutarotase family protein
MTNLNNLKRTWLLFILMNVNPLDRLAAQQAAAGQQAVVDRQAAVGQRSGIDEWKWKWSVVAELPLPPGRDQQPGVAGAYAGISNDVLLIAGGANFPDKKPWQGGKKAYMDDVYVLQKKADHTFSWYAATSFHLPEKLAYGSSVTTANGVVCIGGETETGYSNKVFLMQWDHAQQKLNVKDLPSLPVALANACAAIIGTTIYVAGGENAQHALKSCFSMDLTQSASWNSLPDLPVAMSHSVAVAQSGCLYVIGGRSKTPSGISDLHGTVYCYEPGEKKWRQLNSVPGRRSASGAEDDGHLSAANAVAWRNRFILVMAGDNGRLFHRLETFNAKIAAEKNDSARRLLESAKLNLIGLHPGFSREVWQYDTKSDRWTRIGKLPGFGPVTTQAVLWDGDIFIPCGEIKPGVRTRDILMGKWPVQ